VSDWDPVLDAATLVAFVPTTDLGRAREFYAGALGLQVEEVTEMQLVLRTPNVPLRVTLVGELQPQPFTVLGWEVDDLVRAVTELTARGVTALRPGGVPLDDLGAWTAPTGTRVWWFQDPDGNTLSLSQHGSGGRPAPATAHGSP